jgi:AAA domain
MLIRRVSAYAFGPLVDQTLEFAERMTLVHGGNESAKSSWHAATYAALCGRRRGPGRAGDNWLIEQHRPWSGRAWAVGAELRLDDGRRIEMRQDLEDKVDCHAMDIDLGRDCAEEIMFGGTPDASRWLGLDRQSFLATACILQAQVLTVQQHADGLQRLLQRAAATAGADDTAAAALKRIDAFRRDHVGVDQANSVKPLRRAKDALRRATEALDAARVAHADYETRMAEAIQLRAAAEVAQGDVRRVEAAVAHRHAADLAARLDASAELDRRLGGVEPPTIAGEEETARQVTEALAAWSARAPVPAQRGGRGRVDAARARLRLVERARTRRRALLVVAVAVLVAAGLFGAGATGRGPLAGVAGSAPGDVGAVLALALGAAGLLMAAASLRRTGETAARAELDAALAEAATTERVELAVQERLEPAAERAAQLVGAAAARIGAPVTSGEPAAEALQRWQVERSAAAGRLDGDRRDWIELQRLLGGRTLDQLAAAAAEARQAADRAGLDTTSLDGAAVDASAGLDRLREAARLAAERAGAAELSLAERVAGLAPVGEAEEELARAQAELARVEGLAQALTLTEGFLSAAQQRVHRDIAPVLAATVREWLPEVTEGRYTDVSVDPLSLQVQVCGPSRQWRPAERLSYGTAEQVYLLLRLALTRHLADGACPLLLDDVTVHADTARLTRVLELLLRVSAEQQVILFSQQDQVREWARARLVGPECAVRELAPVPVG